MKQLLCIIQRPGDRLGHIDALEKKHHHRLVRCYPSSGDRLPDSLTNFDAVVIGGGSMSSNDEHLPAIKAQLNWIPKVLASQTPLLGICLGGQLLARALGATVQPHDELHVDIGYSSIQSTATGKQLFPQHFYTYHWNQEGFELPSGAIRLAKGDAFPNQAYCYGNAYGLQFHPEITLDMIQQWNERSSHMLDRTGAQDFQTQLELHRQYESAVRGWLMDFLEQQLLQAIAL